MTDVRLVADAGGRLHPHFGDAVRHYEQTSSRGPIDQYWRAHRAQEGRIRRAARCQGLTLRKCYSECSNICDVLDATGARVMFGDQNQVETWLTRRGLGIK